MYRYLFICVYMHMYIYICVCMCLFVFLHIKVVTYTYIYVYMVCCKVENICIFELWDLICVVEVGEIWVDTKDMKRGDSG